MSSDVSSLKRIDFNAKELIGKTGTKYRIELDSISVGRYKQYEIKAMELGFGTNYKGVFETLSAIHKAATTGDSTLAALHKITELAYGQMTKLKSGAEYKDEFIFCTLFINAEDEDRSVWDMNLAERKIADWVEYDARDFFLCAFSGIEGYTNALARTEKIPSPPPEKKNGSK